MEPCLWSHRIGEVYDLLIFRLKNFAFRLATLSLISYTRPILLQEFIKMILCHIINTGNHILIKLSNFAVCGTGNDWLNESVTDYPITFFSGHWLTLRASQSQSNHVLLWQLDHVRQCQLDRTCTNPEVRSLRLNFNGNLGSRDHAGTETLQLLIEISIMQLDISDYLMECQ